MRSSGRAVNKVPGLPPRVTRAIMRCRAAQLWRYAAPMHTCNTVLVLALLVAFALNDGAEAGVRLTKAFSCSLLQKTVARLDSLPDSGPPGAGWFCDFSKLSSSRWFVVALRSNRACGGDCSNLMGWYAINRRSGEIHSYNIVKLRVGSRL